MMKLRFPFPYTPRKYQAEIMHSIYEAFEKKGHLVLESGTGTGKTVVALAPAVEYACRNGKKVLYLTRTNSQQRQVIHELRAILNEVKKSQRNQNGKNENIFGLGLQGRQNMCPFAKKDTEYKNCTAEELARMCKFRKEETEVLIEKGITKFPEETKACPYYFKFVLSNKTKEKDVVSEITEWAKETIPHAEEINERCEHLGICPYEINKLLVKDAKIVCAPYIYLLHPGIKNRLLDWLGVSMQNLLVIVDEAHNLPEYARDTRSIELSARTIAIAISEIQQYNNTDTHNTEILEGVKIDDFLSVLMEILYDLAEEYVRDEDGLVPPNELEARLMSKFKVTSRKLASAVKDIVTVGMIIQDLKTKELKLPRSYVHAVGSFLQFWSSLDAENYVKIVKIEPSYSLKLPNEKPQSTLDSFDNGNEDGKNEGYDEKYALDDSVCDCYTGCKINESRSPNSNVKLNPKLEAYCLDPSEATSVFLESHATLHMSGTLSPLEEYRDSIGLPKNSKLETYPSPFPRENLLTLYTPDVTTKYEDISKDDAIIPKMESYVEKICQNFERNTAVFFPSFSLMQRFLDDGIDKRIKRTLFVETRSLIQDELMEIVKNFKISGLGKSAVLFSVVGGRISEGIDFPDKELEIAIIVGIPYPKPTAKQKALQYYYDLKFGKGWEYTVKAPTTRRLLQTIGRLIRNETDRGLAVILDRRATQFEAWINLRETKDPCKEIAVFFGIK